jgi:shikimate kinase
MGTGKSTLGKELAKVLNCPFQDSDRMIEEEQKCTVSQIFAEKGETYFRTLENELLSKIPLDSLQVIALGGGFPCYNGLMDELNRIGLTVYLKKPQKVLFDRLINALDDRPLIDDMGEEELKSFISDKLAERDPVYSKAKLIVDSINPKKEELAKQILLLQKN